MDNKKFAGQSCDQEDREEKKLMMKTLKSKTSPSEEEEWNREKLSKRERLIGQRGGMEQKKARKGTASQ